MIEPHKAGLDPAKIHLKCLGDILFRADGHVAQPQGLHPGVIENSFGDDAGGIGKIDEPGVRGQFLDLPADVQYHRYGA